MKALSEQASVSQWPLRIVLTVLTLAVIAAALLALRAGWRRRVLRQAWPSALPEPAEAAGPAPPEVITGKYIGTVTAGDWTDRIVAGGGMARAGVTRTADGLVLDRQGESPMLIPSGSISEVTTSPGLLQKVFGRHGVLMITWTWSGREVSSGLWFASPSDQSMVRGWAEGCIAEAVTQPGDSA